MDSGWKNVVGLLILSVILLSLTGRFVSQNDLVETIDLSEEDSSEIDFSGLIVREDISSYLEYSGLEVSDSWGESSYQIILDGEEIIADSALEIRDSVLYIKDGGDYVISGALNDGRIVVYSEDDEAVRLFLNGANISSSDGAPISILNSGKTIITLVNGTTNYVSDSGNYVDSSVDADSTTAAIYSKDDLYFNGGGLIVISSENKNGVQGKDALVIVSGSFEINAGKEAIKAKDYLVIEDGSFDLVAGEDGIVATGEDYDKGFVIVSGGSLNIEAVRDGIQAGTYLLVDGGVLDIATSSKDGSVSSKGLKAEYYIEVNDAVVNIISTDDGINSANTLVVNSGEISISPGDDGLHADSFLQINGGLVDIVKSVEGIEGKNITINDGYISVYSSDDGINVASSDSGSEPMNAVEGAVLYINGGYLYVNANGDGLDSNGDMYINGGVVVVNGPTNNGNGGLDCNGELLGNGGFLVVAGSSGMAESPDEGSAQNSVIVGFDSTMAAGTLIHIESDSGEGVVTFAPAKTFQSVVLSSSEFEEGKTYRVYVGGSASGSNIDGLYDANDYSSGELYEEFTIFGATTSVGTVNSMGMGGGMRSFSSRRF